MRTRRLWAVAPAAFASLATADYSWAQSRGAERPATVDCVAQCRVDPLKAPTECDCTSAGKRRQSGVGGGSSDTDLDATRILGADRGAWYCAFEADTAIAEIVFHKAIEYQEIDRFEDSGTWQGLLADVSAEFLDLRGARDFEACLDPASYVSAQKLAGQLLEADSMGIVYPSVRHTGGTNLACFRPALVGNVRKGASWRMTWSGTPMPTIEAI